MPLKCTFIPKMTEISPASPLPEPEINAEELFIASSKQGT